MCFILIATFGAGCIMVAANAKIASINDSRFYPFVFSHGPKQPQSIDKSLQKILNNMLLWSGQTKCVILRPLIAQMAELVDASDSKSGFRKKVQVRFLFWAPR